MTQGEKNICNAVYEEGNLVSKKEFVSDGIAVESFVVEYLGETYHMTKHNGEWVYFFHCIKGGK